MSSPGWGGKREGSGRKSHKQSDPNRDAIQSVTQRGYDKLDLIFERMMDSAMGVLIAVRPRRQGRNSDGDTVWECEAPDTKETWHVYQRPPNDKQLQYLYDQLAGRAAAKAHEAVAPDIRVIFGDIDCQVEPKSDTPKPTPGIG